MHNRDLPSDSIEARALRRVRVKMRFFVHALVFVLVHAGFGLAYLTGARDRPFFIWGWAIALAIHGFIALMRVQGEGLRERMLRQEIERMRRERQDADRP